MNNEYLKQFSNMLADEARIIALTYYRQPIQVESKLDRSPVSIADKEIELTLRQLINESFPDHGILGEEFEQQISSSEYLWVIDPIDGTKSYVSGHPTFGTLIALVKNGEPILGLIEMPALKERWFAIDQQPTIYKQQHCESSKTTQLSEAIFCATSIDIFNANELKIFNRLSRQGNFRLFGGDCYNYGLLASGFVDVVIESDLKPFDYMALVPVIKNAGAIVTDWQGHELSIESNGQILACANETLHRQCLVMMNNAASES